MIDFWYNLEILENTKPGSVTPRMTRITSIMIGNVPVTYADFPVLLTP